MCPFPSRKSTRLSLMVGYLKIIRRIIKTTQVKMEIKDCKTSE
jgi:hypothetical protein